jgi:hypothetical protein
VQSEKAPEGDSADEDREEVQLLLFLLENQQ